MHVEDEVRVELSLTLAADGAGRVNCFIVAVEKITSRKDQMARIAL